MGSIASGIYNLMAGDPAQQQEEQLGTLGQTQISTGQNLVTPAATYYENILSGDPSKIAQSLAPEIAAGQGQVEQAALRGANFGSRSGGTAAASRAAEDANRGNIINLVGGLQSHAADAAGSLGSNQENMGAGNVHDVAGMKTAAQNRTAGAIGGIASGAASMLTGMPDLGSLFNPGGTGSIGGHSFSLGTNMGGAVNEGYDPSNGAMTINTGR